MIDTCADEQNKLYFKLDEGEQEPEFKLYSIVGSTNVVTGNTGNYIYSQTLKGYTDWVTSENP